MITSIAESPVAAQPLNARSAAAAPSLVISGTWLKIARIFDEVWLQPPVLTDPAAVVGGLKASRFAADLFTFAQPVPETERRHDYPHEWENWAVAPTTDFQAWWDALPQESRKNVRKAQKRGIVIRTATFDDEFVAGIKGLYDETPLRQGRRFWHYGKPLEVVRRENGTYLDRSEFIGAYLDGQLIGFIKVVYVGTAGRIMQILSRSDQQEKHPTNALLSAAVEACARRGMSHLIYGQYIYGQKRSSSVTEFKRRNGFVPLLTPRYFVPLTTKGRLALTTRLHRPVTELMPEPMLNFLLEARSFAYDRIFRRSRPRSARKPAAKPVKSD